MKFATLLTPSKPPTRIYVLKQVSDWESAQQSTQRNSVIADPQWLIAVNVQYTSHYVASRSISILVVNPNSFRVVEVDWAHCHKWLFSSEKNKKNQVLHSMITCAPSDDSDQPACQRRLIWVRWTHMSECAFPHIIEQSTGHMPAVNVRMRLYSHSKSSGPWPGLKYIRQLWKWSDSAG